MGMGQDKYPAAGTTRNTRPAIADPQTPIVPEKYSVWRTIPSLHPSAARIPRESSIANPARLAEYVPTPRALLMTLCRSCSNSQMSSDQLYGPATDPARSAPAAERNTNNYAAGGSI